jgi:amidophosphoribosyltransferase
VRIASPPVKWPCFYGIDFATRAELIANGITVDEIRTSIGADSLGYVSLDGLVGATGVAKDRLCRACFDGVYPVELPDSELSEDERLDEDLLASLEQRLLAMDSFAVGTVPAMVGGAGAADALRRP